MQVTFSKVPNISPQHTLRQLLRIQFTSHWLYFSVQHKTDLWRQVSEQWTSMRVPTDHSISAPEWDMALWKDQFKGQGEFKTYSVRSQAWIITLKQDTLIHSTQGADGIVGCFDFKADCGARECLLLRELQTDLEVNIRSVIQVWGRPFKQDNVFDMLWSPWSHSGWVG